MLKPTLLLIAAAAFLVQPTQASGAERNIPQRDMKEVQVPFQSLKPSATFKIGKTADWVLVTDDAVWVGGSKPSSVQRIDPSTVDHSLVGVDIGGAVDEQLNYSQLILSAIHSRPQCLFPARLILS